MFNSLLQELIFVLRHHLTYQVAVMAAAIAASMDDRGTLGEINFTCDKWGDETHFLGRFFGRKSGPEFR
jgi:hypothetical protein